MRVTLIPRATPLPPCAVLAAGPVARRLAERMRTLDEQVLARLRVVVTHGRIVVLGTELDLPWVDGVHYLGIDEAAPSLRMPTTLTPSVASDMFERAVQLRVGFQQPVAICDTPLRIIALHGACTWPRIAWEAWLAS